MLSVLSDYLAKVAVWKITTNDEEPVVPNVCSSNTVPKTNEKEENLARHPWIITNEQEEKPSPHSRMQKNEREDQQPPHSRVQKNEQEEQLPPLSRMQMNVVPYSSSSSSSLGYRFTSSGQYQHDYPY
ncbi:unnamed protein product [Vicia faba]|uniref:Uncharacterized protein n=1 Tax=Vicia faba TaxID=3906 RepID=A0AAV0ZHC2_VICFA|nr:unnamed protein product [Vicia faba]